MANKRIIMSVTAGAFIASTFAATEADAATYKVKSGDSLWAIANQFNTSVAALKSINGLSGNVIFPNQQLETSEGSGSERVHKEKTPVKVEQPATASTYIVKRGDSLSAIAARHKISLSELMNWNGLDTYLIHPGKQLLVSKGGKVTVPKSGEDSTKAEKVQPVNDRDSKQNDSKKKTDNDEQVAAVSVYTVRSGDTLSGISHRYNVTVAALKKWNSLTSDLILIGQKLNIGEKSPVTGNVETPSADVDYNAEKLINVANSLTGIGYQWGGTTPAGFDCSGFIYYAYKAAGMDLSRLSSAGHFDRSYYVNTPQIGDLVFFENTYKSGISHMGIYLGNGKFIHAGSGGVEIDNVNGVYWGKHFDSYKRFY
ncbi:LysM peptidoglycan-binding domain-containing protein [Virgibacillus sp. DJP39]|uniref:LysM peptidoglycan-binding domain-containing protein n=1 Tax=Virgibacillus sp. DJP39 TaxID=3409790 RepID=UPI003BB5A5C9